MTVVILSVGKAPFLPWRNKRKQFTWGTCLHCTFTIGEISLSGLRKPLFVYIRKCIPSVIVITRRNWKHVSCRADHPVTECKLHGPSTKGVSDRSISPGRLNPCTSSHDYKLKGYRINPRFLSLQTDRTFWVHVSSTGTLRIGYCVFFIDIMSPLEPSLSVSVVPAFSAMSSIWALHKILMKSYSFKHRFIKW